MTPLVRRTPPASSRILASTMLAAALLSACEAQVFTTDDGGGEGGKDGSSSSGNAGKLALSATNVLVVTSLGGMASKPGHVFLQLDATLANESVERGAVDNPVFFSVELASKLSIALSSSFATLENACSASVTVNPGASTTCGLAFEIPEGDTPVSLVYRDPAGASATASIPAIMTPLGAFEGEWLLTLSTKILPSRPFVYRVSIAKDEGADAFAVDGVPLSEMDQVTPIGSVGPLGRATVDADRSLLVTFENLAVPGAANPITTGSNIVASDVVLDAEPAASETFLCGALSGQVTSPTSLDLSGSTFTLQRIEGSLPAPLLSCAGEPADFD